CVEPPTFPLPWRERVLSERQRAKRVREISNTYLDSPLTRRVDRIRSQRASLSHKGRGIKKRHRSRVPSASPNCSVGEVLLDLIDRVFGEILVDLGDHSLFPSGWSVDYVEPVIGPATSGRTRWRYPGYILIRTVEQPPGDD